MIPNGHFLSPNQSLQISDPVGDSAQRYYNYEKWEIPEVAQVQLGQGVLTFLLPIDTAFRAQRMYGRFIWSEEAPNHINPGDPEAAKGRLRQFVAEISFPSKRFEGYRVSTFARVTAWSPGARRRGSSRPQLFMWLGDTLGLINVRATSYDRPSVCSWRPSLRAGVDLLQTVQHLGYG